MKSLVYGLLLGLAAYTLYSVFVFFVGTTAVKSWDDLCRIEDCDQLPELHVTYEVDGKRYYFPSGNYYSFIPIGVESRPGLLRPTFRQPHPSRDVYFNWRVLDFDLYLETQEDDTLRRGFGRVNEETKIMRFGNGLLASLPEYFGIDTTHLSGKLHELDFFISSKNSMLSEFNLNSHINGHRVYHSQTGTPDAEVPHLSNSFEKRDDLMAAGFESFNDAFWLVSQEFGSHFRSNHVAVVSKAPLLHGRHVYGVCRSQCWFYPITFLDDPPNDEPLVAVRMSGADMEVLKRGCPEARSGADCEAERVNQESIRMRFDVVERVVNALRIHPANKPV